MLNWHTRNMIYLPKSIARRYPDRKVLPPEDIEKISQLLYLDRAIFNFSMKRFKNSKRSAGEDFENEFKDFKDLAQLFVSGMATLDRHCAFIGE